VPATWIAMYSTPGDPIAPIGGSQLYVPTATQQVYAGGTTKDVSFAVRGSYDYNLEFEAPSGQTLSAGFYGHADRIRFVGAGDPGMNIEGGTIGCNVDVGDFVIEDIAFVNGAVSRLAVSFVQHCEGGVGAVFGEASYNETQPGPLLVQARTIRVPPQYIGTGVNLPVWVTNTGAATVAVNPVMVGGQGAADVNVASDTCPAALPGGAQCVVTVAITPHGAAPSQATVTIASGSSTSQVAVTESGIAGDAAFTLDSEPGETIEAGHQLALNQFDAAISATDVVPYGATSPGSVSVTATSSAANTSVGAHTLQATLSAPTGQRLVLGAYAQATANPTATTPGLAITADGKTCTGSVGQFTVREIAFDNTGILTRFAADAVLRCVAGGPALYASFRAASSIGYSVVALAPFPNQLGFPLQLISTRSTAQQVTVGNTGDQPQPVAITVTGPAATDFSLSSTCPAHSTLAPGASCAITITFAPGGIRERDATLVIAGGTQRGQHTFNLTGQGASAPWFTYPVDGQNDVYTSHPFTWLTLPNAQANLLIVGTTSVSDDLVHSPILPGNQTSFQVPALPADRGLYATVFTEIGGHWYNSQPISFNITPQIATFTHPVDGFDDFDRLPAFTWINNTQAGGYYLIVGTAFGATNLVNSGVLPPTDFFYYPSNPLPTGVTLYATLFTNWAGHWDHAQSIRFTYKPGATFTSPSNGQQNVRPTAPYQWLPYAGAQAYVLVVSTTPNSATLLNSGILPASTSSYPGIPLPKGVTIYATIFTEIANQWNYYQTITFEST
jgi:hypothetical protein